MSTFFVPYIGNKPAAISIKGHTILLVSDSPDQTSEQLELSGADEIREIDYVDDDPAFLADLAVSVGGGVVVTPPGIGLSSMIDNLEQQLPWIQ